MEKLKESFLGTSHCGKPLDIMCPETLAIAVGGAASGDDEGKKKLCGGAIAGITFGYVLGLFLLLLLLFIVCRKRSGKKSWSVNEATFKNHESGSSASPKKSLDAAMLIVVGTDLRVKGREFGV